MNVVPLLSAENLSLKFGKENVFSNLSFSLLENDKAVIIGPSGSGKTSLLNIVMGFTFPLSGKVFWNGKLLNSSTVKILRNNIAWLPQEISLSFETVNEFILFPFQFKHNKIYSPSVNQIICKLNLLGLEENILKKKLNEISGGQKQRIAIAICLLLNKKLILLDEPTSSLDMESKECISKTLLNDSQISILSVSHDNYWIQHCSKQIIVKQQI